MKKNISRNAGLSVLQAGLSAVFLFVIYRYLLRTLGIEKLGTWSLIMALTSVSQVGGFGLGGAVIKFTAKYLARNRPDTAARMIETAFLSLALLIGVLALLLYLPLLWSLPLFLPAKVLSVSAALLPLSLLSLWLMTLGGVYLSGLYGCQRIDLRAVVMILGLTLNLGAVLALVPRFGLLGMAYAQMLQAVFLLLAGAVLLRQQLPVLPLVPHHWDRNLFHEMLGYGINFQIISLVLMLFDPLTKVLLSHFGGLSTVGYFEMASGMIRKFQSLVVSANQVIVPFLAGRHETSPNHIHDIYKKSYQLLLFIMIPFYGGMLALIPMISKLWIGDANTDFIFFATLSTIGLSLNTLAGPAYFSYLGSGALRWNTLSHLIMGGVNGGLGFLLGYYLGGTGVVFAWMLAVILGSALIVLSYHIKNKISLTQLFPSNYLVLLLSSLVGILASWYIFYTYMITASVISTMFVCALVFVFMIAVPLWQHPMRNRLWHYIIHLTAP